MPRKTPASVAAEPMEENPRVRPRRGAALRAEELRRKKEEEEEEEEEEKKPRRRAPKTTTKKRRRPKKKEEDEEDEEEEEEEGEDEEEEEKPRRRAPKTTTKKRRRPKKEEDEDDEEEEEEEEKAPKRKEKKKKASPCEEEEEEEEEDVEEEESSEAEGEAQTVDAEKTKTEVLLKMFEEYTDKHISSSEAIAMVDTDFRAPFTRKRSQMFDADGKLMGIVGHLHSRDTWVTEPDDPYAADPKLWHTLHAEVKFNVSFPEKPIPGTWSYLHKPCVFAVLEGSLRLNVKRLRWLVAHGRSIPMRDKAFETITRLLPPAPQVAQVFGGAHVPFASDVPQRQPERVTLPLFHYQLDAVAWMLDLERRADTGFELPLVVPIPESGLLVDLNRRIFVLPEEERLQSWWFYTRGGFLADAVGLGKTISMICLAIQNPLSAKEVSEHPRFELNNLVRSRATLVICPSHLVNQWKEEIEKHTSPRLKTVVVVAITQLDKLTYKDLALADFVIVSIQFISANKNYLKRILSEPRHDCNRERDAQLQAFDIWRRENPLARRSPLLEVFHWHRIVLDEAHETLSSGVPVWVSSLKSTFRWYQSGTPLPYDDRSLCAALRFLDFRMALPPAPERHKTVMAAAESIEAVESWGKTMYQFQELHRTSYPAIRDALFWRNTKESAKEYKLPGVVEEVLLVEQSEVERAMYREAAAHSNELRLRQLCCHPQISEFDRSVLGDGALSMEEIRSRLIDDRKHRAKSMEKEVADLESMIKRGEAQSPKEASLEALLCKAQKSRRALKVLRSMIQFLEGIVPKIISSTSDPCPICLDLIHEPSITTCGHVFCTECIKAAIASNPVCPSCRNHLDSRGDVLRVQNDAHKAQIIEDSTLAKLIEKLGAKMAHLITYIRKLFAQQPEARVIVFSEWDPLLHRVGATLEENGIRNVFVKGNVWCRNKSVSLFAQDGMKGVHVIMLSLENAASGLNLTEATHMVLLEPVAGTEEYAKAVETQAIGRAHRLGQKQVLTIVRLVCKGTIEEGTFERNKKFRRTLSISVPESEAAIAAAAAAAPAPIDGEEHDDGAISTDKEEEF